jgi:hypothetical protein
LAESGYTITLRLRHPKKRPDEISTALQLDPHRCWNKGSARTSPDGQPLGGYHEENAWSRVLAGGPSDELSLAKCVAGVLKQLHPAAEFLQQFRSEGGQSELDIQWSIGDAWPEEIFDHALISELAQMQLDLRVSTIVIADY